MALGLLSPLGEVAIFAAMFMVIFKFHWKQGLWITQGGYEYGLVLLATTVMLAFTGPGSYSLDTLFHFRLPLLPLFGLSVLAAIIVDGIGITISRQKSTAQSEDQVQEA